MHDLMVLPAEGCGPSGLASRLGLLLLPVDRAVAAPVAAAGELGPYGGA